MLPNLIPLMNNGLRNYLRRVPSDCTLYLPGLDPGGSTIRDYSGLGNDGTITGAVWTRLPSGVWVLTFNGNDDVVDCGNNASLYSDDGTWMAWVQTTDATIGMQSLFSTDISGENDGDATLLISGLQRKARFWLHDGVDEPSIYGNDALVDDTPYLIGCNFGEDGMKLFVNGVLQTDVNATQVAGIKANQNMVVGNYRPVSTNAIDGWLALARIFDRALSATEISGIYNQERHLFGI